MAGGRGSTSSSFALQERDWLCVCVCVQLHLRASRRVLRDCFLFLSAPLRGESIRLFWGIHAALHASDSVPDHTRKMLL